MKREAECQDLVAKATLKVSEVALLAAQTEARCSQMAALVEKAKIQISQTEQVLNQVDEHVSKENLIKC